MAQAISIPAPSVTVGNAVSLDLLRLGPLKLLAESGAPASGNATQSLAGANPAGQSSASGALAGQLLLGQAGLSQSAKPSARGMARSADAPVGGGASSGTSGSGKTAGPASAPSTDVRPATAPPVSVEIALPGRSAGIALAFETIATVLRADVRLQAADRVYGNILQALSGIGGRTAGDAAKVTVDDAVRMAGRVLQASRAGGLIDLSGLDSTVAGRKGAPPANAGRASAPLGEKPFLDVVQSLFRIVSGRSDALFPSAAVDASVERIDVARSVIDFRRGALETALLHILQERFSALPSFRSPVPTTANTAGRMTGLSLLVASHLLSTGSSTGANRQDSANAGRPIPSLLPVAFDASHRRDLLALLANDPSGTDEPALLSPRQAALQAERPLLPIQQLLPQILFGLSPAGGRARDPIRKPPDRKPKRPPHQRPDPGDRAEEGEA